MPGRKLGAATTVNSNDTLQLKVGSGLLHRVVVCDPGASWVLTISDSTTASTGDLCTIKPSAPITLDFAGMAFHEGLRVVAAGETTGSAVVIWE